ncbi:MAG: hypothetical protein N3G19_01400 [Candidatus Pacearchaeota archaeon]|nr:hypothetical protein [Candidatus Pacearchaeota archaeon]
MRSKKLKKLKSIKLLLEGVPSNVAKIILDLEESKIIKDITKLTIGIYSYITVENIKKFFSFAAAFFVGSYFKKEGKWHNYLDEKRIIKFEKVFDSLK